MLFWIWAVSLLVKLCVGAVFPLFNDEAYYWVWAHHPSLSYFDHPPFIAWLLRLGLPLEDWHSAVRWPGIIFGHIGLLFWIDLAKRVLKSQQLPLWLGIILLNPLTGPGSIIMTPDVPLLFFWGAALWSLVRALEKQDLLSYVTLGVSLGLGFCAKYHVALFVPITFIFLLFERRWREVRPIGVITTILAGALSSLPVLLWNYLHDWASFRFQLTRGLGRATDLNWLWDYVGGQLALIFPLVLYFAIRAKPAKEDRWLLYFGWLPIGFFLLSSLKGRVEPNWTAIALPSIFILCVLRCTKPILLKSTLALWGIVLTLFLSQLTWRWLPIPDRELKLNEYSAYDFVLPLVDKYHPLYASSYQMAATVSFKTKAPIYKLQGIHRKDHYDLMPESRPTGPEFYAVLSAWNDFPDWLKKEYRGWVIITNLPMDMRLIHFKKR